MALFIWNPKLSVNVAEMDRQHQELAGIINELHDAMSVGRGKDMLKDILGRMGEYTIAHFSAEEELMLRCNYPGIEEQRAQHQTYLERFRQFLADFEAGKHGLTGEVLDFLCDWWITHIQDEDKKYSACANEIGIT